MSCRSYSWLWWATNSGSHTKKLPIVNCSMLLSMTRTDGQSTTTTLGVVFLKVCCTYNFKLKMPNFKPNIKNLLLQVERFKIFKNTLIIDESYLDEFTGYVDDCKITLMQYHSFLLNSSSAMSNNDVIRISIQYMAAYTLPCESHIYV